MWNMVAVLSLVSGVVGLLGGALGLVSFGSRLDKVAGWMLSVGLAGLVFGLFGLVLVRLF